MPDVRLIDANALKRLIKSGDDLIFDHATECEILHMIDYQETIDAQPVKHGKWITTQKAIDDGFTTCSYCHREFYIDDLVHVGNEDGFCEFCPNCGADMRGDYDEQNETNA